MEPAVPGKKYVCLDCDHTFIPSAFEKEFGPHCPRCKSVKIKEAEERTND